MFRPAPHCRVQERSRVRFGEPSDRPRDRWMRPRVPLSTGLRLPPGSNPMSVVAPSRHLRKPGVPGTRVAVQPPVRPARGVVVPAAILTGHPVVDPGNLLARGSLLNPAMTCGNSQRRRSIGLCAGVRIFGNATNGLSLAPGPRPRPSLRPRAAAARAPSPRRPTPRVSPGNTPKHAGPRSGCGSPPG